jgi:SET domain-containing protein
LGINTATYANGSSNGIPIPIGVIDATVKGGIARFLNHCCKPNIENYKARTETEQTIWFRATKIIYPYQEMIFNFQLEYEDRLHVVRCFCGSKVCTGYLNYQPTEEESSKPVSELRSFDHHSWNLNLFWILIWTIQQFWVTFDMVFQTQC